jgi:hypothetical protein
MTGVVGALVALAALMALVLVLVVRPPARRLAQAAAVLRVDTAVRLDRLRAERRARTVGSVVPRTPAASPAPPADRAASVGDCVLHRGPGTAA